MNVFGLKRISFILLPIICLTLAKPAVAVYERGSIIFLPVKNCQRSMSNSYQDGSPFAIVRAKDQSCLAMVGIGLKQKKRFMITYRDKNFGISPQAPAVGNSSITINSTTYTQMSDENGLRALREQNEILETRRAITPFEPIQLPAYLPASGIASTPFGFLRFVNGKLSSTHKGLDIANEQGTEVFAPFSGTISLADDLFYTGNTVMINHGQGTVSLLGHLQSMVVSQGNNVKKGQLVGYMGSTGRSTGSHLHWGVTIRGKHVNPALLLSDLSKSSIKLSHQL